MADFGKFHKKAIDPPFAVATSIFFDPFRPNLELPPSSHNLLSSSLFSTQTVTLKVQSFWNEVLEFLVDLNEHVIELKQCIEMSKSIRIEEQNLVFKNKNLKDEATLRDCDLHDGDVLNLYIKLKSGGCFPGNAEVSLRGGGRKKLEDVVPK